jgi:hypothetical protein
MRRWLVTFLLLSLILLLISSPAVAQSLSFQVPKQTVDAYWNSDGTLSLDYTIIFNNSPSGSVIDFIDLGLPNDNYSISNITASVDGNPVTNFSSSDFQGKGCCGVAIGLGQYAIAPGSTGTFQAHVSNITGVLYPDTEDSTYASADFAPSYFGSEYVLGNTDMIVTFHLPPGVQSQEPKYHSAPDGFPSTPVAANDADGRIIYVWENKSANVYTLYEFGASFPASYVPSGAIVQPSSSNPISFTGFANFLSAVAMPAICIGGFFLFIVVSMVSNRNRKQAYLPPKISIEGHGIKRGLTAVEAAILLEQPLDKVMTMILFSVVKKNTAEVVTRDPLDIKVNQPIPEDLQPYEKDFLSAFQKKDLERRKGLRDMVINLVKNVSEKMKGFSRSETIAYYTDITKRAWEQVEAANTPEVKSQKYEEVMEWTMLDKHYGDRTQEVFRNMPVFIPTWWGHYDPGFGKSVAKVGGASMPSVGSARIPGTDFAASVVAGVNTFSTKAVGSITDFTSSITSVTNPAPKPSSGSSFGGSGGHGCACACACACAGCACACAGGGR